MMASALNLLVPISVATTAMMAGEPNVALVMFFLCCEILSLGKFPSETLCDVGEATCSILDVSCLCALLLVYISAPQPPHLLPRGASLPNSHLNGEDT